MAEKFQLKDLPYLVISEILHFLTYQDVANLWEAGKNSNVGSQCLYHLKYGSKSVFRTLEVKNEFLLSQFGPFRPYEEVQIKALGSVPKILELFSTLIEQCIAIFALGSSPDYENLKRNRALEHIGGFIDEAQRIAKIQPYGSNSEEVVTFILQIEGTVKRIRGTRKET